MNDTTALDRILVPMTQAQEMLGGIGKTLMYELIDARKVQRVKIGRRSFVTVASLNSYTEQLIGEQATAA